MTVLPEPQLLQAPYPGLRPFTLDEAALFFGREPHVDQLLSKLQSSRFLSVLGPSGCGKSSLVRAGLLAALDAGFLPDVASHWQVAIMRPGERPLARLATALLTPNLLAETRGSDAQAHAFLQAALSRGPLSLAEILQETPLPPKTNLLLIVDQFEEIFRYWREGNTDEAEAFVALLLASAQQAALPIYVIITMRSDFLGNCTVFRALPEALNEGLFLTPRLTRAQSAEAIVGPARLFGGDIDPALVTHLLNDFGTDPDQLPLLQHALMRMWQQARIKQPRPTLAATPWPLLTLDDYTTAGGLSNALSRHADEIYGRLDSEQQRIAIVMFRCLSERDEEQREIRHPMTVGKIAAVAAVPWQHVALVAEAFRAADCNFLMPPPNEPVDETTLLDISHESLIRQWVSLQETWLKHETDEAAIYRRLRDTAQRWDKGSAALLTDLDLSEAREWQKQPLHQEAWALRYGEPEDFARVQRFIVTSQQKAEEQEQREAEQRHQRAQLEQHAQQEREQRLRLFRRLTFVMGTAVVIVAGLAYWAWRLSTVAHEQRHAAESYARKARAQAFAANAEAQLSVDPERSILLALEAIKEAPTQRVTAVLRRALNYSTVRVRFTGHQGAVSSVALSPDGQWILTGSSDKTARLWEAGSGQVLREFAGHQGPVQSVAFSPDGQQILTGSDDKTARLWETSSGQVLREFAGHQGPVQSVAFSPAGQQILTGSDDKTARLWETSSGQVLREFAGHQGPVWSVAFSPAGQQILTGSGDKTARLWEANSGQVLQEFAGHQGPVWSVAFSPAGQRVLTGGDDNTARLWEASSGQLLREFTGHQGEVWSVAFSSNGQRVLTGSDDNTARLWEASSGQMVRAFAGHQDSVSSVAFSPDGQRVLTGSGDKTARLWEASSGQVVRAFAGHQGPVLSVALSPDGRQVLTGSDDNIARLWEVSTGRVVQAFAGHQGPVLSVALSPDGQQILTGSGDKTARLWEASSGQMVREFSGHQDLVQSVALSADGQRVLTGSWDKTARLWEASTGQLVRAFVGHQDSVQSVALSADGQRVLTGSWDKTARLWEASTGQLVREFAGHQGAVLSVALSADGQRVLTGSGDNTARLWEAGSGQLVQVFSGHQSSVFSVALSPDGQRILTGSHDKTARLWEADSGQLVQEFSGHQSSVFSVALNPDGQRILTGSGDKTARLWRCEECAPLPVLLKLTEKRVTRQLADEERRFYLDEE